MSLYEVLMLCIIVSLPVALLGMCFIKALSKRPGYRRRRDVGSPTGVERRCPNRATCPGSEVCRKDASKCILLNGDTDAKS